MTDRESSVRNALRAWCVARVELETYEVCASVPPRVPADETIGRRMREERDAFEAALRAYESARDERSQPSARETLDALADCYGGHVDAWRDEATRLGAALRSLVSAVESMGHQWSQESDGRRPVFCDLRRDEATAYLNAKRVIESIGWLADEQ